MEEYEMRILIDELEKLVVSQAKTIRFKDVEISSLKKEIKRLEELLTPTIKEIDKPLAE